MYVVIYTEMLKKSTPQEPLGQFQLYRKHAWGDGNLDLFK